MRSKRVSGEHRNSVFHGHPMLEGAYTCDPESGLIICHPQYMQKRSCTHRLKHWQQRWFLLSTSYLLYRKREEEREGEQTGAIDLRRIDRVEQENKDVSLLFNQSPSAKAETFTFRTSSVAEAKRWCAALKQRHHHEAIALAANGALSESVPELQRGTGATQGVLALQDDTSASPMRAPGIAPTAPVTEFLARTKSEEFAQSSVMQTAMKMMADADTAHEQRNRAVRTKARWSTVDNVVFAHRSLKYIPLPAPPIHEPLTSLHAGQSPHASPLTGPNGDVEASGDDRPSSLQRKQPPPPSKPPPNAHAFDAVASGVTREMAGVAPSMLLADVLPCDGLAEVSASNAPQAKPLPPAHPPPRSAAVIADASPPSIPEPNAFVLQVLPGPPEIPPRAPQHAWEEAISDAAANFNAGATGVACNVEGGYMYPSMPLAVPALRQHADDLPNDYLADASASNAPRTKPLPPAHPPPRCAPATTELETQIVVPAAADSIAEAREGYADISSVGNVDISFDSAADGDAGPGSDGTETCSSAGYVPAHQQKTRDGARLDESPADVVLDLLRAQLSAEDAQRASWRAQITEIENFTERARWSLASAAQRDEDSCAVLATVVSDESDGGIRLAGTSSPSLAGRLAALRPPPRYTSGSSTYEAVDALDFFSTRPWTQHSPDVAEGLRIARGYRASMEEETVGYAGALSDAKPSPSARGSGTRGGKAAAHSSVHITRRGSITIRSNPSSAPPLFGAPAPRELSLPFEAYPPTQVPTFPPVEIPEQERIPARVVGGTDTTLVVPRLGDDGGFARIFDDRDPAGKLPWARLMYLGRNGGDEVVRVEDGASALARFAADDAKLREFSMRSEELQRHRRGR